MTALVVANATLKCSEGTAPSRLAVSPDRLVAGEDQPGASVQDYHPTVNVKPFGLCTTRSNPKVASAKSPQPCEPMVSNPWVPGSSCVAMAGQAALTNDSTCACRWGGTIEICEAGQVKTEVG